jgi:hypothetical protein
MVEEFQIYHTFSNSFSIKIILLYSGHKRYSIIENKSNGRTKLYFFDMVQPTLLCHSDCTRKRLPPTRRFEFPLEMAKFVPKFPSQALPTSR